MSQLFQCLRPPLLRVVLLISALVAVVAPSWIIFKLGGGALAVLPPLLLLPLVALLAVAGMPAPASEPEVVAVIAEETEEIAPYPAPPPQPVLTPLPSPEPPEWQREREKLESLLRTARLASERMEMLVADSREAERQSRMQTRRLWEVFYQLNHPAGFLDPQGHVLDLNATALQIVGMAAEEVRGKPLAEIATLGGPAVFQGPLERAKQGETVKFELELMGREDGTHVLVVSLKPVRGDSGEVELLILEGHDITERIRAEAALQETFNQFQQSQKMEAIGRLAGGIAHDFNNLLTSILGFANMALESLDPEHEVSGDLREVVQAATRAQNLTQKLLALSRKELPASRPVDLNHLLREMDNLIRVTLHENLELVTDLSPESCVVMADMTSMEQVVINLAVNARDAMPRSGRLYIRTYVREVTEENAEEAGLDPGEYVALSVRDTGCGMTPEVLEHAFEPFFTTKEAGQGTGLGLSTVYAIVKQFQGVIRLESEPGVGTEFTVLLPRIHPAEQMLLDLPTSSGPAPLPRGHETILLVEDEEAVRRMASRMIESLGYKLLSAADGEEGVRVAESYPGKIDLIITDVVMPNLSGPEMIDRLRLTLGYTPHLYVSGFTMDKLVAHGADDSEQFLIRKPYSRETLARRIREVLDRR